MMTLITSVDKARSDFFCVEQGFKLTLETQENRVPNDLDQVVGQCMAGEPIGVSM